MYDGISSNSSQSTEPLKIPTKEPKSDTNPINENNNLDLEVKNSCKILPSNGISSFSKITTEQPEMLPTPDIKLERISDEQKSYTTDNQEQKIIGENEMKTNTITVKNMFDGSQKNMTFEQLLLTIK